MGSWHCLQKWSAVEEAGQAVGGMHEGVIITGILASLPLPGGTNLKDRTGQANLPGGSGPPDTISYPTPIRSSHPRGNLNLHQKN